MNKTAIKNYAIWARVQLIEAAKQRAFEYEITDGGENRPNVNSVGGRLLSETEKQQRNQLLAQIASKGFQQTMEEAAYTWFNRFIALRYMEVNGYLPSHVRLFTDGNGEFKPEILKEAMTVELDGLDRARVLDLIDRQENEELYKLLIIAQCNSLGECLPGMFEKISNWTELLFPANVLREDGVLGQMVTAIPEDDWKDAVQIIGWLYQYYNAEPKDKVFENLKKNIKISKENIPAATQLFTPDWIVRYMVENSLGRLWVEGHPNDELKANWKYYLEEAEQEPDVQAQLAEIRKEYAALKPEEIKVIDPCMGSGHILVYMFDVLVQIYESYGYNTREAAGLILENNLYGLDIDDRAAQLAYFAVMMKARQVDRRIFSRGIQPHVYAIVESNGIHRDTLDYFENGNEDLKKAMETIVRELHDAKEYGSILNVTQVDFAALYARLDEIKEDISLFATASQAELRPLIEVAEAMAQKYHAVVTNPPYMGSKGMSPKLGEYVKQTFPTAKTDLFACFIQKGFSMLKPYGFNSQVTMQVWMFLTAFDKFREQLFNKHHIISLLHMDNMVMGIAFGTSATVFRNGKFPAYNARYSYATLNDIQEGECPLEFPIMNERLTTASIENMAFIPRSPVAYWASANNTKAYFENHALSFYADIKKGMSTADDERFLRLWHEVQNNKFQVFSQNAKWFRLNKGGSFRRWYGNNEYVVNWEHNGSEMKAFKNAVIRNEQYYLKPFGLTWTYVTNYKLNVRYYEQALFAAVGPGIFPTKKPWQYILGFLNTKVAQMFADNVGGETITYEVGEVSSIPLADTLNEIQNTVVNNVEKNVEISKIDWDYFETSWDFMCHPLVAVRNDLAFGQFAEGRREKIASLLSECFKEWESQCLRRFYQLRANEEELNRIFIDIYGLQDELTPEVDEKDVTVRKADLGRDIRSLISYAVGCMFGRYSLDCEGLAYAGGEFSDQWVVVSGQYYKREVVEYYVCKELSRVNSMAEIYEFDRGSISSGEVSAKRRDLCAFGSDAQGGGVDPFQYRRGAVEKLYAGICELSINSERVELGAGNAAYDLCSPAILDAIANGNGNELVSGGWKDADHIDWKAIHCSLTTNHYTVDYDGIIPICDDDYFEDDIAGKFIEWVKTVYGSDTLEENLRFIADALTTNHSSLSTREIIRKYFLDDFYADHLKIYQKRPIYWLFDGGKKNGFKALIYMHRYQPDTIARMRTDYVHEQQERYRTQLQMLENAAQSAGASERVKLNKQITKLKEQSLEIQKYEEKIHHLADQMISIDLDDGVKHNYELFADVLAKIK